MIIDPSVIAIGATDGILDHQASRPRYIALAVAGAIGMTALNIGAVVYLYRGISELRATELKLGQLSKFEAHIIDKMELVNTGVHSRFEKLDGDLQGKFSDVRERLDKIEREGMPRQIETGMLPPTEDAPVDFAPLPPTLEDMPQAMEAVNGPVASPRPTPRASLPAPSSSYQRLESADGKVYYRKVK
ncbi:hypothetical protein [Mesorhizobium sp. ANAO-SY3R2]|uniref:hypothetical protein n=1 Tax=Mesorhizobium sp. ANAO-SY3R2 TaxID=3166644 RepID=UPI00366F88BE